MSSFAFFLLCVQACFIQNVFTQCAGPIGYGPGIVPAALAPGYAPYGMAPTATGCGAYGGTGMGDVTVAGDMPVTGTTLVAGQVPILGVVRFSGELPAAGTVAVAGSCGCGCNRGPY